VRDGTPPAPRGRESHVDCAYSVKSERCQPKLSNPEGENVLSKVIVILSIAKNHILSNSEKSYTLTKSPPFNHLPVNFTRFFAIAQNDKLIDSQQFTFYLPYLPDAGRRNLMRR
jgi:hypothetical protein